MNRPIMLRCSRTAGKMILVMALLAGTSQRASAALLNLLGLEVSENKTYKEIVEWIDPVTQFVVELHEKGKNPSRAGLISRIVRGAVDVIDPALGANLISGRITVALDPNESVLAAGWFGEFGANPGLPAPPIGADPDIDLLQIAPNPALVSSHISIDQVSERAVFEFNWGAAGFVPTQNMDATGHFNFIGLILGPESSTSTAHIVGGAQDVLTNGVNASTYLLCSNGTSDQAFCGGTAIPEPSTLTLIATGLVVCALVRRRSKAISHFSFS